MPGARAKPGSAGGDAAAKHSNAGTCVSRRQKQHGGSVPSKRWVCRLVATGCARSPLAGPVACLQWLGSPSAVWRRNSAGHHC